jgi:hypothetical protein
VELIQVTDEIYQLSKRLDKAASEVYKLAVEKANKEKTYRMELSKQITILKAEGLQAVLISDVARGNVADLKYERDLADGKYWSAIEALGALQSQLSALQTVSKYHAEVGA